MRGKNGGFSFWVIAVLFFGLVCTVMGAGTMLNTALETSGAAKKVILPAEQVAVEDLKAIQPEGINSEDDANWGGVAKDIADAQETDRESKQRVESMKVEDSIALTKNAVDSCTELNNCFAPSGYAPIGNVVLLVVVGIVILVIIGFLVSNLLRRGR